MPFDDTIVLATACITQPKLGQRPGRTLLVGAATLTVRRRFTGWTFDLKADSSTITDNPHDTMLWLTDQLGGFGRLLLWRPEDIVVPSLVSAAETSVNLVAAAKLLRELDRAFGGEVVDVAITLGGARATSFDAVAHAAGLPFLPLPPNELTEMHRFGNDGRIRDHLSTRVSTMWRLWLSAKENQDDLVAATDTWLAEQAIEVAA